MRFLRLLPLLFAVALPAQQPATPPGGAPVPWDTISIHVTDPARADNGFEHNVANGLSQHAMTINFFIAAAYTFTIFPSNDLLEGLPDWTKETHYDVEARVAPEDVAAYKKLTSLSIPDTVKAFSAQQYTGEMLMAQALLVERFHLKVHTEMRERNVFLLTLAKGGLKMKPAADPAHGSLNFSRGKLSGRGVPVSFIGSILGMPAGGIVVDRSGADGQYDFELHYAPEDMSPSEAGSSNDPDFFIAIQEQLGLKLTRGKAQVPVVVIDHIEKPTDN
ncbi:TIGR03435 family protein [Terriglobus sp. RCC_193]|uniref:TIGR03435 family protein n=1 Tax=Terriglobus sp. RCC_193 TaxID=3239218 RepID=UPI00352568FD